jgi:hypothetical protein
MLAPRNLLRSPWFIYVELVFGFAVATAGIAHTIWALPDELHELRPGAHHGIALLGFIILFRGITELLAYVQYAGEHNALQRAFWRRFHHLVAGPRAEGIVGALIVLAGLGEVLQLAESGYSSGAIWHWGVLLIGFTMIARFGFHFVEGLAKLGKISGPRFLHRLSEYVEKPHVHAVLAIALLTLSILELLGAGEVEAAELASTAQPALHAAHGQGILGGLALMRALPDMFKSAQMALGLLPNKSAAESPAEDGHEAS